MFCVKCAAFFFLNINKFIYVNKISLKKKNQTIGRFTIFTNTRKGNQIFQPGGSNQSDAINYFHIVINYCSQIVNIDKSTIDALLNKNNISNK